MKDKLERTANQAVLILLLLLAATASGAWYGVFGWPLLIPLIVADLGIIISAGIQLNKLDKKNETRN